MASGVDSCVIEIGSLRDYFAGQALAGLMASFTYDQPRPEAVAIVAYGYADAMLKAREARNG